MDDDENEPEEEGVETESEEEEEEIEELEEMTSPRISTWLGADGKTYKGVMVVDDDISCQGNKCQYDDCIICFQPITNHGKHPLCCLPCGHLYGFSCITKWLGESSFSGKTRMLYLFLRLPFAFVPIKRHHPQNTFHSLNRVLSNLRSMNRHGVLMHR